MHLDSRICAPDRSVESVHAAGWHWRLFAIVALSSVALLTGCAGKKLATCSSRGGHVEQQCVKNYSSGLETCTDVCVDATQSHASYCSDAKRKWEECERIQEQPHGPGSCYEPMPHSACD